MRDEPAFRGEVERMRPLVADLEALPGEAWDAGAAVPPLPPLPPLSELEERRARRRLSIRPAVRRRGEHRRPAHRRGRSERW